MPVRLPLLAWTLATIALAAALAELVIDAGLQHERDGWLGELVGLGVVVVVLAMGLLVVHRSPVPRIGLLLVALATVVALSSLGEHVAAYVFLDERDDPWWARLALAMTSGSWVLQFACVAALALLFPTGRPLTPRWRRVLLVAVAGWTLAFAGIVLSTDPNFEPYDSVAAPFDLPVWLFGALFVVGWPITIASLPAAVVGVVVRYRRARGVERLQLKWLALAVGLLPLLFVLWALDVVLGTTVTGIAANAVFVALMIGVPLAVAVALTRYRLYEIDWIVDRTLYYAALTALLAAVWVGVAAALGAVVGEDAWVAAVATAAAALLAGPARRRLQDAVDRRFARARYDGVRRVRAFEDAIRDGTASPDGIEDVVRLALDDPRATLLLRLPEPDGLVDVSGAPVERPPDDLVDTPVQREGEELAVLFHDPAVDRHPQLVRAVLAAATLSIELARLQTELQRQLAEVEVSRERIVRAGYAERRRLERDLHDGAQQRLVGLGIRLRRIQRSLPAAGLALEPALDAAVADVQHAIDDLRTIARGLRPAGLDDGLAVALAELARSVPVRVEVDAPAERLPDDVEAAAYYVACEAVTNAIKHASPSTIRVAARHDDGVVRLVIADDGAGGARPTPGHGLAGLADRVGAHGGELHVESPPGEGTRVEVVIPCAGP